jgi:cyclic beta-1,2-glucan synthetase
MYRVGLEAILGFRKRGDLLFIEPSAPAAWPEYRIVYRCGRSVYDIVVTNPGVIRRAGAEVTVDGRTLDSGAVPLVDDGQRHTVMVHGREASVASAAHT